MNTAEEAFEGIALHDRLAFRWEPDTLDDPVELDHVNQETARVLQAMAVFEEAPREHGNETGQPGAELMHLEAKIDVLLSLVGMLIADRQNAARTHSVVLRPTSLEWTGPDAADVSRADCGYALVFANPLLPLTLKLPARIVSTVQRNGAKWIMTRFEHLSPGVESGMEKLVFRRHRRQVALVRATGIHSDTGVFHLSKS